MNEANRQAAITHAKAEFPREACGLVLVRKGKEVYLPCRNIGVGSDNFVLHPQDYADADAQGDIVAVFHSHPNLPPTPSQADRVACESSGLVWHIVGIPTEQWQTIKPSGYVAPLIGRQWSHGVLDCYAIVRDWYAQERSIALPDFERHDEWWLKGQNLYVENFDKAGFRVINENDLKTGDLFIMQIMSPVPNHAAVYLGDDVILHHIQGRLSTREVYGGYWRKHTTHILRHENYLSVG